MQVKAETLHDAAKLGDREAAEALIAEGAEVNAKDARGITPLGIAVGHVQELGCVLDALPTPSCCPLGPCGV